MARGTWSTIRVSTPVSTTATAYGSWILPGSLWQGSSWPRAASQMSLWFVAILNGSTWPHVDPAPFAKVFSVKLEIYQKRESFVPRKFPAIRYQLPSCVWCYHICCSGVNRQSVWMENALLHSQWCLHMQIAFRAWTFVWMPKHSKVKSIFASGVF